MLATCSESGSGFALPRSGFTCGERRLRLATESSAASLLAGEMGREKLAVGLEFRDFGAGSLGAVVPGADAYLGPPVGRPCEVLHLLGGHGAALVAE